MFSMHIRSCTLLLGIVNYIPNKVKKIMCCVSLTSISNNANEEQVQNATLGKSMLYSHLLRSILKHSWKRRNSSLFSVCLVPYARLQPPACVRTCRVGGLLIQEVRTLHWSVTPDNFLIMPTKIGGPFKFALWRFCCTQGRPQCLCWEIAMCLDITSESLILFTPYCTRNN